MEKVEAAVVSISAEEVVQARQSADPFDLFSEFFQPRYRRGYVATSLGSGVVVDARGFVLTNFHVIERGAKSIKVSFDDGRDLAAKVVGTDPDSDLAVLKIDGGTFPFVPMGSSSDLLIGETVIAIGNPFGLSHTVTTGVVSALGRAIKNEERQFFDFVQIDASINPGNSGGPLLNIDGELIGINTAIYGNGAQGIGFAIPIERAKRVSADLLKFGEVRQPWVGAQVQDMEESLSEALGAPVKRGAVVSAVEPESPALRAGIRDGDVIVTVNGKPVGGAQEYRFRLGDSEVGKDLPLELFRGAERKIVTVRSEEFPAAKADALVARELGIELFQVSTADARKYGLPEGAVALRTVRRASPAQRAGLSPGDLVAKVNSMEVSSMDGFRKQVVRARRSGILTLLTVRLVRGGYVSRPVSFTLD